MICFVQYDLFPQTSDTLKLILNKTSQIILTLYLVKLFKSRADDLVNVTCWSCVLNFLAVHLPELDYSVLDSNSLILLNLIKSQSQFKVLLQSYV